MTEEKIIKMKQAMQTIGEICKSNTSWSDCDNCPFDEYCTAINDVYWEHNWHDMGQTFCKESEENDNV